MQIRTFARRCHCFSTFNRLHVPCAAFQFESKTHDLRLVQALNTDSRSPIPRSFFFFFFWPHMGIMTKPMRKWGQHFHLKPVQWHGKACAFGHVARRRVRAPANVAVSASETARLTSYGAGNLGRVHAALPCVVTSCIISLWFFFFFFVSQARGATSRREWGENESWSRNE